jgi:hypothetical protein
MIFLYSLLVMAWQLFFFGVASFISRLTYRYWPEYLDDDATECFVYFVFWALGTAVGVWIVFWWRDQYL